MSLRRPFLHAPALLALAASLGGVALDVGSAHAGPPVAAPPDATLDEIDLDRPLSAPPRTPTPESRRVAADLYNDAIAELKKGRARDAFRLFRISYEQDGAPEALANMAVLEARIGRPRAAAEHLALAIDNLPPEYANRADDLKARLADIAKQVGVVHVRLEAEGDLYMDGKWIGTGPFTRTVYVDPGKHTGRVLVRSVLVERTVEVQKGQEKDLAITRPEVDALIGQQRAEAAARAAAAAPPTAPRGPSTPVLLGGLVATGAFVVLGGVGLGVQLRAASERAKIDEGIARFGGACPATSPGFSDDCRARNQEAGNESVGIALAGTGFGLAAATGLGTLLYVLIPSTDEPSRAARLRILPAPGGALLQGTF